MFTRSRYIHYSHPYGKRYHGFSVLLEPTDHSTEVFVKYTICNRKDQFSKKQARLELQSKDGAFEPASLFVHLTPAVVPGEHRKAMLLCANCHRRFHTDDVSGHHSDSTH